MRETKGKAAVRRERSLCALLYCMSARRGSGLRCVPGKSLSEQIWVWILSPALIAAEYSAKSPGEHPHDFKLKLSQWTMSVYADNLSPRWEALGVWRVFCMPVFQLRSTSLASSITEQIQPNGSVWAQLPRSPGTMLQLLFCLTQKKLHSLCLPGLVSSFIVAPARSFPAAELVPGVSLWKSLTNQDLMMKKHTCKCGISWCQQTSSLCLLRCQCRWPKLNLSPDVFLLFLPQGKPWGRYSMLKWIVFWARFG